MAFCKEDNASINQEYHRVMKEIQELSPTTVTISDTEELVISHNFLLTMIDGKIINAISKNSATSVSQ